MRNVHVVHLLIRENLPGDRVGFLVYPHEHWRAPDGSPYLALPAKKTVTEPLAEFLQGTPLDVFVEAIVQSELRVPADRYALEGEVEAVEVQMRSPTQGEDTCYVIYPLDVWVSPAEREPLRQRVDGQWYTCEQTVKRAQVSPTAKEVLCRLSERHEHYTENPPPREQPAEQHKARVLRRSQFSPVPDQPSMDALANKWLSQNLRGVRHLPKATLDGILDAGNRAFNLRVADPYLRTMNAGRPSGAIASWRPVIGWRWTPCSATSCTGWAKGKASYSRPVQARWPKWANSAWRGRRPAPNAPA